MEKAVNYEMQDRKDGDNLQLISGSVASPPEVYSRIDRKEAQRSNCMIYCCILSVAVIAVLALCAACSRGPRAKGSANSPASFHL